MPVFPWLMLPSANRRLRPRVTKSTVGAKGSQGSGQAPGEDPDASARGGPPSPDLGLCLSLATGPAVKSFSAPLERMWPKRASWHGSTESGCQALRDAEPLPSRTGSRPGRSLAQGLGSWRLLSHRDVSCNFTTPALPETLKMRHPTPRERPPPQAGPTRMRTQPGLATHGQL